MADNSADSNELADIRRLACDIRRVELTVTAKYDLMGRGLSKEDVCQEVVAWIDRGDRVKRVTLRGKHAGQPGYVMKPRINNEFLYIKLTLCALGGPGEYMLIISVHPDH